MGSKNFLKYQKIKKILKFCQKVSKVSGDSFMALYDPIVPEKSNFWKKIFEKVLNTGRPPALLTFLRDIMLQFDEWLLSVTGESIESIKKQQKYSFLW